MRSPPSAPSGLFAGRYAIERVIGHGATAIVHLARDTQAGTAVALKILRPELAQSAASARFLTEIRRTSALQHPHILPVLDSGEHQGQLYFALPYMEEGTLRQLLKQEKNLELARVVEISRTVAEALDYAHQRGLIHRDVKPENILFTSGQACLGDFGIARALDLSGSTDGSTSRNTVRGTPAYMSPEQAAGATDLDGRSDIYSLACVIYEMITGMAAFIGPTPESVISQRFAFAPREIRVYRPSAPPSVDAALAKGFVSSPSDRYRTAGEMVKALEAALATSSAGLHIERRGTPTGMSPQKQRRMLLLGSAIAAAAALMFLAFSGPRWPFAPEVAPDTTRLVLLPLERLAGNTPPWSDDDLLRQSLSRWRDVKVVDQYQVADAIRRRGPVVRNADAAALSRSLFAGRYIRARISPLGNDWHVSASLYDVSREDPLYSSSTDVPAEIGAAAGAYARLADTLLLRGAAADSIPMTEVGSRSLPAVQAFSRAQLALDDWNLEGADSLFQVAVGYDAEYARASLWLAQVRAWEGKSRNSWGTVAERASAIVGQLNDRERRLASALVLLAHGSYDAACSVYDTLRLRNDRDFAAWFGLGQCRMSNRLVFPDVKSPSGWSFRTSSHRAMQAYEHAFEILPSVHRGYERGAFSQLRLTLRTTTSVFIGYSSSDSAQFYARPGWMGDTLVFIPYPWRAVASGDPKTIPPNFGLALAKRREAFRRIAGSWSAAFPKSSGAKYAVAVALETLGDASAIDTLRLARGLATDQPRRRQLAATEVILLVKFGIPDNPAMLTRASALADSLLSSLSGVASADAELVAQVAMLVGACGAAEHLAAEIPQGPSTPQRIGAQLYAESQGLLARIGAGCRAPKGQLAALANAFQSEYRTAPADRRQLALDTWVSRPVFLAQEADSQALKVLAADSRDPFILALWAYARGKTDSTRYLLMEFLRPNSDTLTPSTPDIAYPIAHLAVLVGDTAAATRRLDETLANIRRFDPTVLTELLRSGSLVRCIVLRADLAMAQHDVATARKWGSVAAVLLGKADVELKPELERMKSYRSIAGS